MDRAKIGTFALAALLALFTRSALAEGPTVAVTSSCAESTWKPFLDQLAIELAEDKVTVVARGTAASLELRLDATDCGASATTTTLRATRDGLPPRSRQVTFDGVSSDARPRVLALAAAELLRGLLRELPPQAKSEPIPIELALHFDPPPVAPPPPPPPRPPTFALSLAAEGRAFPNVGLALFGARAGLSLSLAQYFALAFDAGIAGASATDPLGDVSELLAGGSAGFSLTAGSPSLRLHVGPRLEVDYLRAWGTPVDGGAAGAAITAPLVLVRASGDLYAELGRGAWALVGVDVGAPLLGYEVAADRRVIGGAQGPLLGLRIGLAWSH